MYDSADRLHECPDLCRLLEHYAQVSTDDSSVWQDRPSELAGVTSKELVQLHGELLAHDWVEQNTGVVVIGKPGVVAACYRVTAAGRRVLRLVALGERDEEAEENVRADRAA